MIGKTAGGYQIDAFLAKGGMGAVYTATHPVMGGNAVVKLLHLELSRDADQVQRFFNEARAAASIDDPGIVKVFDVGHLDDGRAYLVMERLAGETLAARLRGGLRIDEAVNILRMLFRTLGAAHAHGIVHRDLKPENIFLVPDRDVVGGERTKILDFGIAKLAGSGTQTNLTQAGSVFGTPAYMAPEQAEDASTVDARADLYAMGCIAYEMFAGAPPFGLGGMEVLAAQLRDEPEPLRQHNAAVPAKLEALVMRLLRKLPAERYASSDEVLAELDAIAGPMQATPAQYAVTTPTHAREVPGSKPSPTTTLSTASGAAPAASASPAAKRRYLLAMLALVTIAAIGVGVFALVTRATTPATVGSGSAVVADLGNALADALTAQAEERWVDAIVAAEKVTRDGELPRARAIIATARAESQQQPTFAVVEHAAAQGDVVEATKVMRTIPTTSRYRARAEAAVHAAEAAAAARVARADPKVKRPTTPTPRPPLVTPETSPTIGPPAPVTPPTQVPPPEPVTTPPVTTPPVTTPPVTPKREPTRRVVEAGPIGSGTSAAIKCPKLCTASEKWVGTWWTTVKGKMSVCECLTP